MVTVNRGDLVKTEEGYYGIVLRIAPNDQAVVAISNGLIWDEPPETLERLPLQFDGSIERGDAWANFMEILKLESESGAGGSMQAISLYQPWAQLVVLGAKRAETRSWPTTHRGEIAIHASRTFPGEAKSLLNREPFHHALFKYGFCNPANVPLGALIGTVEITGCYRTIEAGQMGIYDHSPEDQFGDFSPGRWFWTLANPVMWDKPKPCKGALKIWTVPEQISI